VTTFIKVTGLKAYVVPLKGKVFKDVNRELRVVSKKIATEIRPDVVSAVRQSKAPQAWPMSATTRVKSDRVPVLSVGAVNPRFTTPWRRGGQSAAQSKKRRGALAHGVVYGTAGGRRKGGGDYYKIPRDESGGPLGKSLSSSYGLAMRRARVAYKREYLKVLRRYGFDVGRRF
jgi:hypothetical protein